MIRRFISDTGNLKPASILMINADFLLLIDFTIDDKNNIRYLWYQKESRRTRNDLLWLRVPIIFKKVAYQMRNGSCENTLHN